MEKKAKLMNCGNDFYSSRFEKVCEELEKGESVHVYIECIGHTRNNCAQDSYKKALTDKYGERLNVTRENGAYCYSYTYSLLSKKKEKRRYSGDYFIVKRKDMSFGLDGNFDTIEDARKAIEHVNELAIKRGYKPDEYIIISVEWYRYFDENGIFEKEETIKQICD